MTGGTISERSSVSQSEANRALPRRPYGWGSPTFISLDIERDISLRQIYLVFTIQIGVRTPERKLNSENQKQAHGLFQIKRPENSSSAVANQNSAAINSIQRWTRMEKFHWKTILKFKPLKMKRKLTVWSVFFSRTVVQPHDFVVSFILDTFQAQIWTDGSLWKKKRIS